MKTIFIFSIGGLRVEVALLSLTKGMEEKYRTLLFILYISPIGAVANAHKVMEMARGSLRKSKFAVAFCVADPFR